MSIQLPIDEHGSRGESELESRFWGRTEPLFAADKALMRFGSRKKGLRELKTTLKESWI